MQLNIFENFLCVNFGLHLVYMKIWVLCGRNAQECHSESHDTLADHALLYLVLAKWVQTFRSRRLSAASMYQSECSVSVCTDVWVVTIEQCMDEDWHWTMKKVAMHRGIFGSAVLKVLWQDLKMRKFAAKWMPHTGNEAKQWSCYETCHNRLE
jgi:hypothetical protein